MDISIERAKPADYSAIAELNVEAYHEYASSVSSESWNNMRKNLTAIEALAQRAVFLIVRVNGELAGSVAYCPPGKSDPAIFPPHWASLLLLAVSPRHRGYGIAKRLIAECIRLAQEDHASAIGLFTSELMTQARRIYETMGFKEDCELPLRHGLRYWRLKCQIQSAAKHKVNPEQQRQ